MTGKKILNASGKGRATYQSTANQHILVNVPKNPIKQSISAASISSPMANKFSSIPPATPTSTIVPNTPASFTTIIKTSENLKYLPLYSAAVTKPSTDSFAAEDLDSIQLELELLLSAVALRYRSLKTSFDSLDREDKKKSDKHGSAATVKRKRDDAKKQGKDAKSSQPAKITKVKANSIDSPSYSQHTDDSMDAQPMQSSQTPANSQPNPKLLLPKNDLPNKFWLSVEPYCMPITQEDVKLLEDMIEEYSKPLLPPIPDLGSHYTSRWAAEDLRDEQDNSNSNAKANKRFTNAATPNVTKMLKKGEDEIGEGVTGPLTQRLVAALFEENLLSTKNGEMNGTKERNGNDSNSESANQSNINHITSMLKNGIHIEQRLKKELIELGIFDMNDFAKRKEDEVMNEIKRVRVELKAIADYNLNELKQLLVAVKEEMKRLEIKQKLDQVDQEIIDWYKKVVAAKQKRRPLTKQEKHDIYRLIAEQKRLGIQLDSLPLPGNKRKATKPKVNEFFKHI